MGKKFIEKLPNDETKFGGYVAHKLYLLLQGENSALEIIKYSLIENNDRLFYKILREFNFKDFNNKIPHYVGRFGNLKKVKYIENIRSSDYNFYSSLSSGAMMNKNLEIIYEIIDYLLEYKKISGNVSGLAPFNECPRKALILVNKYIDYDDRRNLLAIANNASSIGHLEIVNKMIDLGIKDFYSFAFYAILGNQIKIFKEILELANNNEKGIKLLYEAAANRGRLDFIKYLIEKFGVIDYDEIAYIAAMNNRRNVLNYILNKSNNIRQNFIVHEIILDGKIEIIEELIKFDKKLEINYEELIQKLINVNKENKLCQEKLIVTSE